MTSDGFDGTARLYRKAGIAWELTGWGATLWGEEALGATKGSTTPLSQRWVTCC